MSTTMHHDLPLAAQFRQVPGTSRRVEVAAVLAALAFALLWYWQTTVSIVSIWYRSETYAHGFVILPIVAFLVWRERDRLAAVPTSPFLPALLPLALVGLVWVFAELANVLGLAQFMLAAMVPLLVWVLLGTAMLRALAFPLAFLFFAIPFGEFLLPQLMDWTADFTIVALKFTGIPVYRDGNNFVIPSGNWSVVEACSGLRYLIASLVVGTLYAYLTYRSFNRRLAFVAVSIVVPLVANWLRAYMIVMIGHLSGNKLATGVDHIIYGWIFFGVVMAALFWIASFWRQDDEPSTTSPDGVKLPAASAPASKLLIAWALALAVVAVWRPALATLERAGDSSPVRLPEIAAANGWSVAPATAADWKPEFTKPAAELRQSFAKGDAHVGVYVAHYRGRVTDGKLVSSGNRMVGNSGVRWLEAEITQTEFRIDEAGLRLPVTEIIRGPERLLVTRWYVVDGRVVGGDQLAALRLGWQRLLGRGDDGAIVVIYTEVVDTRARALQRLEQFAAEMGGHISHAIHP
jgi:exosortase A